MIDRRAFLGKAAALSVAVSARPQIGLAEPTSPKADDFELDEATVADLQNAMSAGKHTAVSITRLYLERIERIDQSGPNLRSVIETNPDALQIAERLDAERAAGRVRGPLHGIPVLIKDNIDTNDRMQTTAGSLALIGAPAPADADLVTRLRNAGAILIGKTNLSEWANFRSTHSSSGWSGRGGQCKNPYVLDRNPCGSSSGSGAAISANLAAIAVGTETDGSIVCPSSANGLVGIKPTVGLISGAGIIPISHNQDTAGPMSRTVRDAAILLNVLAANAKHPDYTRITAGIKGARIGVARKKVTRYSEETDAVFGNAIDALKHAGAIIVDPADIPHLGEYDDDEYTVLLYDFKSDLNGYLAKRGGTMKTLKDLIDFNDRNADREMPYFRQEIFHQAQEKGPLSEKKYVDALARCKRLSRAEGLDLVMKKNRLAAIIAPTGHPAWPTDLINGDHFLGASSTPAAVSGYPSISIPAGYVHGLPVGISFIGLAYTEPTLLRLAYTLEQTLNVRKKPGFVPTLNS